MNQTPTAIPTNLLIMRWALPPSALAGLTARTRWRRSSGARNHPFIFLKYSIKEVLFQPCTEQERKIVFNLRWTYDVFRNKRFAHNTLDAVSYTPDSRFPVLRTGGFRAPEYPQSKGFYKNFFNYSIRKCFLYKQFMFHLITSV